MSGRNEINNQEEEEKSEITSMSYLDEIKFDNSSNRCLLVFFESVFERFGKKLVVFGRDSRFDMDIRKIVRIRLINDDDLVVIDTLPTKTFRFRSTPPLTGKDLFKRLTDFTRLKFENIDEQYLNKDGCPLLIDKLCSFIEIYHLTERLFYSSSMYSTFDLKSNRLRTILARLESERDFALDCKQVTPATILCLFRAYFNKYIGCQEVELIRARKFNNHSSVLFALLKRLTSHLVLVSRYQTLNKHSIDELARLFAHLISPDGSVSLDDFVLNYTNIFGLSEEFFKLQSNIVDKLISMRAAVKTPNPAMSGGSSLTVDSATNRLTSYLAKIFWMDKTTLKFVQVSVTQDTRVRDVLRRVIGEFDSEGLFGVSELSLFEVGEQQFCSLDENRADETSERDCLLLERVLPVDSLISATSCHDWARFSLVVKKNYFCMGNNQSGGGSGYSGSFHDTCLSINSAFANPVCIN